MQNNQRVFPDTILEQSSLSLFPKTPGTGLLYYLVMIVIIVAFAALFFIEVDVHVNAPGVIKPKEDHTLITSTASGYIHPVKMAPNTYVSKGDTLFFIQSESYSVKRPMLENRQRELDCLLSDLRKLTTDGPEATTLESPYYQQDVLYFLSQRADADAKLKQAEAAYLRARKLHDAQVIPESEFEPVELAFRQASLAAQNIQDYQIRQWQSDITKYSNERREIEAQLRQIKVQESEAIIFSPVCGTIQQTQSLFDGSYIQAGQQIAEISPEGNLIAECYIPPKDIAFLRPGMSGRLQVSAFNPSEWGTINITVEDVFNDVSLSSDGSQSFYKVYCSLSSDHLALKNGFKGYIKKGMSVYANFSVTRRTVFHLLYDKLDNWLNPNIESAYEARD
jgi:HlyD family secretion protein